ncbi:MAG: NAD(P)/FAD-dependent oxidoreductase [Cellulosilyticaceae bacterium]
MHDVIIVGGGVIGCAIARELSRYSLDILLLEKENDVCCGTSKANSAIVHAGFDAKPGTLKGKFNAPSNLLFDELSKELDFPFKRNGSFVLCFSESDLPELESLKAKGIANGVPDLQIMSGDQLRQVEPNVTDQVVAALYAPTGGIVCSFNLTLAFAENACTNGVKFEFNSPVTSIVNKSDYFTLLTPNKTYETKLVINAAGLYSDVLNNMVSSHHFEIIPRKGEYNLFDKYIGNLASHTLFQLPTKLGKGVLVSPTVDGNLLVGPNAVDQDDKDDFTTTREGLDDIMQKAHLSVRSIPLNNVITSFCGLRARSNQDDFILGECPDVPNFINAASIESPGLTCAPLIGKHITNLVVSKLNPLPNPNFNPKRQGIIRFHERSYKEQEELIKQNPAYSKIVCRCESITEAEIVDALTRPLGAKDLDGIKRRTRAGAGRCQAGFCLVRNMELLSEHLGLDFTEITKFGKHSNFLVGPNKENL